MTYDYGAMKAFIRKIKDYGMWEDPAFNEMWNVICEAADIKSPRAKGAKALRHDMTYADVTTNRERYKGVEFPEFGKLKYISEQEVRDRDSHYVGNYEATNGERYDVVSVQSGDDFNELFCTIISPLVIG